MTRIGSVSVVVGGANGAVVTAVNGVPLAGIRLPERAGCRISAARSAYSRAFNCGFDGMDPTVVAFVLFPLVSHRGFTDGERAKLSGMGRALTLYAGWLSLLIEGMADKAMAETVDTET